MGWPLARFVDYPSPVGRKRGVDFIRAFGQTRGIASVNIHAPDVSFTRAVRRVDDVTAVGRNRRVGAARPTDGQLSPPATVRLGDPEVVSPAGPRGVNDLAVGSPRDATEAVPAGFAGCDLGDS